MYLTHWVKWQSKTVSVGGVGFNMGCSLTIEVGTSSSTTRGGMQVVNHICWVKRVCEKRWEQMLCHLQYRILWLGRLDTAVGMLRGWQPTVLRAMSLTTGKLNITAIGCLHFGVHWETNVHFLVFITRWLTSSEDFFNNSTVLFFFYLFIKFFRHDGLIWPYKKLVNDQNRSAGS